MCDGGRIRLFTSDSEEHTQAGIEIADKVYDFINPILQKAVDDNLSIRDVELVILREISTACAHYSLGRILEHYRKGN